MANVNVTIRMDESIRKEATILFEDLGISFNQAVNVFVKQALREQGIPFEITKNIPNKKTKKALKQLEEMESNPDKYTSYNNVDELFDNLDK